MDTMTTYRGRSFDPLHPDSDQLDLADIAHALSLLCRGGGHTRYFYSVAQHALACCMEARQRGYDERVQLACLLHDASEAYLCDLIRPLKQRMPEYQKAEDRLQMAIWKRYLKTPLTDMEEQQVYQIDDAMLVYEFEQLMAKPLEQKTADLVTTPSCAMERPDQVEQRFMETVMQYLDER